MSQEPLSAFHVMGFEDADELQMKSDVMVSIKRTLRERDITTQGPAAEALGMNRSEVSLLLGGKVSRFTLDRLIKAHNHLDKGTRISLVFGARKAQPTTAHESQKPTAKRTTSRSLAAPPPPASRVTRTKVGVNPGTEGILSGPGADRAGPYKTKSTKSASAKIKSDTPSK